MPKSKNKASTKPSPKFVAVLHPPFVNGIPSGPQLEGLIGEISYIPDRNYLDEKVMVGKAINKSRFTWIEQEVTKQSFQAQPNYDMAWSLKVCYSVGSDTPKCFCNNGLRPAKFLAVTDRQKSKFGWGFYMCSFKKEKLHPKVDNNFSCSFFKWQWDILWDRCQSRAFQIAYPKVQPPDTADSESNDSDDYDDSSDTMPVMKKKQRVDGPAKAEGGESEEIWYV
jgi:hypothetical protein